MCHLCIDIDNVVAETDHLMRKLIRKHTRSRVKLCYEDVIAFDYCECQDSAGNKITREEWGTIHAEFSKEENILSLSPVNGVQGYLERLAEAGFELHFVTSRLSQARIPTITWLENHNFPHHRMHFVKHREKHVVLGSFCAIIEDDLMQAKAFADQGTLAFLIAHPWNVVEQDSFLVRVADWQELVDRLLALKK